MVWGVSHENWGVITPLGGLDKSLGCVVLGVGQRAPFPSAKGFGEALWARTTGFKAETRPPIGFLPFSALRTLSYCLLWIPKKTFKNSYPIQYLSQLLYIWWCYVMFLVYETYFTSESRKRWSLGGTRHFREGNSRKKCIHGHCMLYTMKMCQFVECLVS